MSSLCEKDQQILDCIFNPNQSFGFEVHSQELKSHKSTITHDYEVSEEVKELEISAVKYAEEGKLDLALSCLNKAVDQCPLCASIYNNRAQVQLLKGNKEFALLDIEKALKVSNGLGEVASQAFTQRALIHRLNGNDSAALEDFRHAASLGNLFAKSQIVEMNPYAALCNQMLAEAIFKLRYSKEA